jgi:hypothetical protein
MRDFMQTNRSIELIRRRRDILLTEEVSTSLAITLALVKTALHQGVTPLSLVEVENSYIIGAEYNWIRQTQEQATYIFDQLLPLEGIQNSFRGEALLTAFADFYAFVENGQVVFKSEDSVPNSSLSALTHRAGAFCIFIGTTPDTLLDLA